MLPSYSLQIFRMILEKFSSSSATTSSTQALKSVIMSELYWAVIELIVWCCSDIMKKKKTQRAEWELWNFIERIFYPLKISRKCLLRFGKTPLACVASSSPQQHRRDFLHGAAIVCFANCQVFIVLPESSSLQQQNHRKNWIWHIIAIECTSEREECGQMDLRFFIASKKRS